MTNNKLAYHCFRIAIGVSILIHGAVRIPKIVKVAEGISSDYVGTILEGLPSLAAGYMIPIAELLVGLTLLIGWKVIRYGLASGILLMGILMIGTCLLEKWGNLPSQIIHAIAFYILLVSKNTWQPNTENYN